ncbi:MAG: nicotinamide-nucleotide amidohydrolase family protein [Gammaproteobacteria bacterium]|nr:nicotinamide-nucleotide amidohydrolase family protein [Gammaproteobacteria bacterium]
MSDAHEQVVQLADLLVGRSQMLAVAESCTGGWVAKCLTDLAGSSRWFERGFVTYSNAAKQDMLGVPEATLGEHGAVSEATVLAMVEGVLAHSRADVALAVSGIAGPGGAAAGKPVGTVCFAWALRSGYHLAESCRFEGDRDAVRRQAVVHTLARLVTILQDG